MNLNTPDLCEFEWLCEECYPEKEMVAYRQTCNCENCNRCPHYRDFYEGYYKAFDP